MTFANLKLYNIKQYLKNITLKNLFSDIRFWIIFFFILRLFNINYPIFDSHHWRQADGYAIARNFLETDANIFYPRINHAGELSGIMGSEFPIMNYIVFLLYKIFGVDWWQGRLLNLIISSVGCFYFYKIIFKFINKTLAFNATFILLVSIWFAHSRKFMPDVFSTSLVIISVYYGISFLKDKKSYLTLLLYSVLLSLGLLSKLPAFVMLSLLTPFIFDNSINNKRKIQVISLSIISLIPVVWWYFYWAPYLTKAFGFNYFFMGENISVGIQYLISEWGNLLKKFYTDAFFFIAFFFYLIGIFLLIYKHNFKLLLIFISASILQIMLMLKGGKSFVHHSYYIIPFVPVMALFSAYGLSIIKSNQFKILLLSAIAIEGILNQQHDFRKKPHQEYQLELSKITDLFSSTTDLIAINGDTDPTLLYFAHRKGWTINSADLKNQTKLNDLYFKGCQLIIWDKHRATAPKELIHFKPTLNNKNFKVFVRE